jgi:hypothetical protein
MIRSSIKAKIDSTIALYAGPGCHHLIGEHLRDTVGMEVENIVAWIVTFDIRNPVSRALYQDTDWLTSGKITV